MSLNDEIVQDLKEAMKAKDALRVSCLRMLKTAVKNKQVEQGRELNDDEVRAVISSLVRKAEEAVKEFTAAGRDDLAQKEDREMKIFFGYLPAQLGVEEIEAILKEIISEMSVTGTREIGKVMKAAMPRMAGRAQGKEVNRIAACLLSA